MSLTDNVNGGIPLSLTDAFDITSLTTGTGFFRLANGTQALFQPTHVTAVVAAVPEASTWAMMILGFLWRRFTAIAGSATELLSRQPDLHSII